VIISACSGTKNTAGIAHEGPINVVDNGYQVLPADNVNQSNIMVHPNRDQPTNMSLTDMMRRLPGVRVQNGRGPYAKIKVDGPSSFIAETDPLFVVNGTVIGTDFSNVYTMVSPNNVVSLSVLKGSDASIYGVRGSSGVIMIRTK
jgi:TonB-dependent SusC/RagA subfamily outer membrane receptor